MDNNYILTPDGNFVTTNELRHWGIKGMQWGKRRYQNPDGSLTPAGRKRYMNSDGSLTEKGKKFYKDETARLKAEKSKLANEKKSNAQFDRLDKMRKENDSLKKQLNGEKDDGSADDVKRKSASDMNDKELQDRVNRLRNEDAYRDLNKKLGYDEPKTELDAKIAEMEKQKKYLELQRDINNLTPKQENKIKKLMDKLVDDVLIPSAVDAGKKTLTSYLTEAGSQAVGKALKKEADKIDKAVTKSVDKVAEKEAKEQAKAERKKAEEEARAERREAEREARAERREAEREARAERREAERAASDERSASVVNAILDALGKNKSKSDSDVYGTKSYEQKVDQMLDEMDDQAWEMYNKRKRGDD